MAPTTELTPEEQRAADAIRSFYSDPAKAEQAVNDYLARVRNPDNAGGEEKVMVPWLSAQYGRAADIKRKQAETERLRRQFTGGPEFSGIQPGGANYQNPEAVPGATDSIAGANDPTSPYYQNPEAAPPEEDVTTRDQDSLYREPWNWDTETYADITQQMLNVGLLDEGFKMVHVLNAWKQMVDLAAMRHAERPEDMLTPLDMLDIGWGNGEGSEGSAVNRDPVTVVERGLRISTNEQARGLLRGMLAEKLGRKPTAIEVDDFQAALNEAQRANPTITTTTNFLNAAGRETSEIVQQEGGLDANEFAEDYTDWRDPDSEYGKYQAATTYYNALVQAIRGPGGA